MERESQFFKLPERPKEILIEKPIEIPSQKPEEAPEINREEVVAPKSPEVVVPQEKEFILPEEEKFNTELEAKEKAEKEKGEFFDKMQRDEQEMTKGILRKVGEASPRLRKAIMILATAGIFLSAGKAFAGSEHWQKTHWGWQNPVRQVEQMMPQLFQARESQKTEAIQHQYQLKEKARFDAYQSYKNQVEAIQKVYEQRKFDIMIGRVEGATDYFGKQKAYQELEQWRYNEEMKARQDWALKAWAAEEEYRQKVYQIQQWR